MCQITSFVYCQKDCCQMLMSDTHLVISNGFDKEGILAIIRECCNQVLKFQQLNKQNQWLYPGQIAEPVANRKRFSRKTLLSVWWNFEGVIHYERASNKRTIDADLYCAQLD